MKRFRTPHQDVAFTDRVTADVFLVAKGGGPVGRPTIEMTWSANKIPSRILIDNDAPLSVAATALKEKAR